MVLVNDAHDDMDSQWLITYHESTTSVL